MHAPIGVYVHLPFCPYLCPYCDFAKWPYKKSAGDRYLDALLAELGREPVREAQSIFLGGGTPNAYDARTIAMLVARLRERFPSAAGATQEISIELNPELVSEGDLPLYRDAGIDRVSIGVQSFVAQEIRTLGRRHTIDDVARAVTLARGAGLRSVSLDLIFGVPGQTRATWLMSLETAIALGVDHISTYGLTVEEGTPYERWQRREPAAFANEDLEAELYDLAISVLEAAGYRQYEISNFARPGHESRHNANYWANGEYVGIGVGAASYRDGVRSTHTRKFEEYVEAAHAGAAIPGQAERLVGLERAGEAIMLALRTAQGVDLTSFKERYDVDVVQRFADVLGRYGQAGLLVVEDGYLRLTRRGRFVANDVCGAFLSFE